MVSDGTGGLISMVSKSFFQGPVGFTYVFSCAPRGTPSLLGLSTQKAINTLHLLDIHLQ